MDKLSKGSVFKEPLTESVKANSTLLYCIPCGTVQNKFPLKHIEIYIAGKRTEVKREGTPHALDQGVSLELGDQFDIAVEIIQDGMK